MAKETTALLAVRIEKSIKDKAVQRASGLGISLTTAIKGLLADFVGGKPVTFGRIQDDQYIEFYENNPNMIHFDPPLTLEAFGALLDQSLQQDGKATQSTRKVSASGQK